MKSSQFLSLFLTFFIASPLLAQKEKPGNLSLRLETERSIGQAVKWLNANQNPDGSWSDAEQPAITALAISAILGDPTRTPDAKHPESVVKALAFIRKNAHRDGGIYGKGLANYNTAVSLNALLLANQPEDIDLMKKARRFLVNQQSDFDVRGKADNVFDGGVGYGGSYAHSDLSNTHLALEALHYSKSLVKDDKDAPDLDWGAAIDFVTKCQNLTSSNPEPWASDDPKNKGGFVYFPGDSKAGEEKSADGRVAYRSYGSMSYAGLLSLIYAEVDQQDPRVKSVLVWLENNFTLEENPGLDQEGLFYYYHTMAKALRLSGKDRIKTSDGKEVKWREDLCKKLFNLQSNKGNWTNPEKRWWEGDPVLTTCYATLALEHAARGL